MSIQQQPDARIIDLCRQHVDNYQDIEALQDRDPYAGNGDHAGYEALLQEKHALTRAAPRWRASRFRYGGSG